MVKQSGKLNTVNKTLNKAIGQHFSVFKTFAATS